MTTRRHPARRYACATAAGAVLIVPMLTGCGDDSSKASSPVTSYPMLPAGYADQIPVTTGQGPTTKTLAIKATSLYVAASCVGKTGELTVSTVTNGHTNEKVLGVPCTKDSGAVGTVTRTQVNPAATGITITTDSKNKWSLEVASGTH